MKLKIAGLLVLSVLLLTLGSSAARIEYYHYKTYKHFVAYGLHADVMAKDDGFCNMGMKKVYAARLHNFTIWPAKLDACNFMTGVMEPERGYPYAIQKWNSTTNTWETIKEYSGDRFCTLAPLGKVKAELTSQELGIGQYVETEWEETGAEELFQRGDKARFVVFQTTIKDQAWKTAIPSYPFTFE